MIGRPLLRELRDSAIAAMTVADEDATEAAVREPVEDVPHDVEVGLDPERDRTGKFAEVGSDAVGDDGEDRDAERLRGLRRHPLWKNAIDSQSQMAVLFGAAQRQHGAVVVRQVLLHLHPVHVGDEHRPISDRGGEHMRRASGPRPRAGCIVA